MSLGNRSQYYYQSCIFVTLEIKAIKSRRPTLQIDEMIYVIFWNLGVSQAMGIQIAFPPSCIAL